MDRIGYVPIVEMHIDDVQFACNEVNSVLYGVVTMQVYCS